MHITNTANGKNAWGMVRDECPSCGAGDLGQYLLASLLSASARFAQDALLTLVLCP